MKKILILFLGILVVSCSDDFLDQVPDDRLTFEETFANQNTIEQYLANIYSRIPDEKNQRGGVYGPWVGASDNADYVWSDVWSNMMNNGSWDPNSGSVSALWSHFYRGIRSSSTFIQNADLCQDCDEGRVARYKAEARALRAFFYYNLVRSWGPVILLGDEPLPPDADLSGLQRNTMQECIDYITSELLLASQELEDVDFQNPSNLGMMSKPFALAIREKALLLNASPLFNGNSDYGSNLVNAEGEPLISQTYDPAKWKLAADAAKAFIDEFVPGTYELYREDDENGNYSPYLSTRNVLIENWNEEIIFARVRGGNFYNYDVTPFHANEAGEVKGGGGLAATQDMVDAYFTANGRDVSDPQSGYQENGFSDFQAPYDFRERETYNQWVNREPRFYVGITYNNSLWLQRNHGEVITETWYSGNSGTQAGGHDYPTTGYVVRKGRHTNVWWDTGNSTIPMLRLAEIYLDYVEALNEYEPGNPDILLYLNEIRDRAGIPGYGSDELAAPQGQDEMREAIRRERRVELAFEGVRYFDVRRWKIADEELDGPSYGLDVRAGNEDDFYNVVVNENRVFNFRHYLWPIPQDERNSNPDLGQNPDW